MTTANDFTLKFGKYKGQLFSATPKSYQAWLTNQDWFRFPSPAPKENISTLSDKLACWNGHSARGQAIYDRMFELERDEPIALGIECTCGLPKAKNDRYCNGDHCAYN
jgi:hypothetical protein